MTVISPALEHADAKTPATRTILPRRNLPNGRALMGALLISIAAVGAYATATSGTDGPTTRYLVITSPVDAGQPVSLSGVSLEAMDLPADVAGSVLNSTDELDGATALRDLRPGEILYSDDLLAAPTIDGSPIGSVHELSFPVPLDRTPGGLVRGDRVTVLSTLRVADTPTTMVAIEDAIVLSFDSRSDQLGSMGTGVLTLAIGDAGKVVSTAHLSQQGELTIIRSTRAIADRFPSSYSLEQPELAIMAPRP